PKRAARSACSRLGSERRSDPRAELARRLGIDGEMRVALPRLVDAAESQQRQLRRLPRAVVGALAERARDGCPAARLPYASRELLANLLAVDFEVVLHFVELGDDHPVTILRGALCADSTSSVILSAVPAWARTRAVASRTVPSVSIRTFISSP